MYYSSYDILSEITNTVQMNKWFFRFLKVGCMALGFLLAIAMTIIVMARPNPQDIALVPMSVDPSGMKAAGFVVNSTQAAWVIYVAGTNESTADVKISRIWVTTNELQAVSYDTPAMGPKDKATFRIVYARKLDPTTPKNTSPPVRPPSSRPSPAQSLP